MLAPHAVAATAGALSKSDQPGVRRERSWCTREVGGGRFGEAKSGEHPGSRPARHALRLPLDEVPFGFTKGTFPTALQGLLVNPNIIEVSVGHREGRDKEHC